MMTIGKWFDKNAKQPLVFLGGIVLCVQLSFIYHHLATSELEQTVRIKNLVQRIAVTAIEQSNRDMLEAAFTVAVEELGAKKILLCKKDQVFVSFPRTLGQECKIGTVQSFFSREIEMQASGYSDYKFLFLIPRWRLTLPFVALVFLTTLSIILCFVILFRVQKRLQKDILKPLETKLFSTDEIGIVELNEIKEKVKSVQQTERERAVVNAKKEIEAKFIHNVQSPLGKLNTLKDRLKAEIDPTSAELLEAVVTEISDMTLDYARSHTETKGSVSKFDCNPDTALVEINLVLNEALKAKNLELSKKATYPKIDLVNNIGHQVYVEANLSELRSILSNLLNNSVESGASAISILTNLNNGWLEIVVKDNGNGVSETIRNKLFEKDVTFGKATGTGFGLYHARKFIEAWGGSINLVQTSKSGSSFWMELPIYKIPALHIRKHHQVVILEDDVKSKEFLKSRILQKTSSKNSIIEFQDTKTAMDWLEGTKSSISDIVLFADNDLGADSVQGIDVIKQLGLEGQSYLVTNSFNSSELLSRCKSAGIAMIPKPFLTHLDFS